MLHNLALLSASSLLEYLQNQLSKPIVIEDIIHPVTINEDGEEEYEPISQMPSQTSRISQVLAIIRVKIIQWLCPLLFGTEMPAPFFHSIIYSKVSAIVLITFL